MIALATGVDHMQSIADVAKRLDVSVMTIRRLVWKGELPAYKIGGRLKFRDEDIEEYIKGQVYKPKDEGQAQP